MISGSASSSAARFSSNEKAAGYSHKPQEILQKHYTIDKSLKDPLSAAKQYFTGMKNAVLQHTLTVSRTVCRGLAQDQARQSTRMNVGDLHGAPT